MNMLVTGTVFIAISFTKDVKSSAFPLVINLSTTVLLGAVVTFLRWGAKNTIAEDVSDPYVCLFFYFILVFVFGLFAFVCV